MKTQAVSIAEIKQKAAQYMPPDSARVLLDQVPFALLAGIAGAGKDTTKDVLLSRYPDSYHHVVSHTTRSPRENKGVMEQDGVDYHFIDWKTANVMLDKKAFIEVNVYSNNIYGTSIAELEAARDEGKIPVTDIDIHGTDHYVRISRNARPIFLLPPSFEVWRSRFLGRYSKDNDLDPEDVKRRMSTALHELMHVAETDYYYLVVNDDLADTIKWVDAIARGQDTRHRTADEINVLQELMAGMRAAIEA